MGNFFGKRLVFTSFGESHGVAVGGVLDGVPAGLVIDSELLRLNMERRAGGRNLYATQRKEADEVEILSGVVERDGALVTTGASLGLLVRNINAKSSDYAEVERVFRPGHADFSYFAKYGLRDHRGGGRASARESASRVAAGSIAAMILARYGIVVESGIAAVGGVSGSSFDFEAAKKSEIFALDSSVEAAMKEAIMSAKNAHDSIGGVAKIRVKNMLKGLGEPIFDKLDSALGAALLGLNGVKAVEIGAGASASKMRGSQNNDLMSERGFLSNNAGGVLGGISNGADLEISVFFKPTPSIFLPQSTIDSSGNAVELRLKGRHDPCIAIRGSVVAEAMVNLVLADLLLLNATARVEYLDKIYKV